VWAALVLAALAGAIAGLFFYIRPDPVPVLLAMPVTQYDSPDWPPNPWAEADASGLRDRFPEDSAQASQAQAKDSILARLRDAVEHSRGKGRPLVVYLCLLGTVADGTPYLLPGDARPDDREEWMTLADVLEPLAATPHVHKLVILDVRPAASPRSVLPAEDVNDALDAALAQLDQAGQLPLRVLTAHNPPTGANVVRPLKRTAFGLAVGQAVAGSADGWGPSRTKDRRVSVEEFVAYVRQVTHALSAGYGHPPQLPRIHGKGADFVLAPVENDPALPALADPEPLPGWWGPAWTDRDKWVKDGLHRRAPRVPHHLGLAATRAERRWLAGDDPKRVEDAFVPLADSLRAEAARLRAPVPKARSVARVLANPAVDVKGASAALQTVFRLIRESVPPKKGEKDPKLDAAMQAAWAKPPDGPPHDATAAAIFSYAVGLDEPKHLQVKHLAALAAGLPERPRHPEILALELVAGIEADLDRKPYAGAIRALLRAAAAAETAAVFDGRLLPWLRERLERADADRLKATAVLCNPNSGDRAVEQAVRQLQEVIPVYENVRRATVRMVADVLGDALREYEETRAVLVDLAVAFPHELAPRPEAVETLWEALVDQFRRLHETVYRPQPPNPDELERALQTVRSTRRELLRLLDFRELTDRADPRRLEAALAWPGWTHPERKAIADRLDTASRAAAERMLGAWPTAPGQEPPVPERAGPRVAAESARDLRRVVDLLTIADVPDVRRLAVKTAPQDVTESWRLTRQAWRVKLPEVYKTADRDRRAAIGWAIDPDDVPAHPRPELTVPPNPELIRARAAEKEFHGWLAERYRREAAALRAVNARAYADALDALARDLEDWSP
jgi:hypothetical protein